MSRIVLLNSQNKSSLSFLDQLAEVLGMLGWEVIFAQRESDLVEGDTLLVLGLGNWSQASRPYLIKAGQLGTKRILWSCEPLLPPDLPQSQLLSWYLGAHGLNDARRPGRMQRVFDRVAYCGFTIQSWGLPWNEDRKFPVRQFAYPAKESRRLLKFWRDGLIDSIWVSLKPRQDFLSHHGIPSSFVPIGHHPNFGRPLENEERDIDVVFLGNVSRSRRTFLQKLTLDLGKSGYKLHIVSKNCYGEERTRLLNRSKILINLNNYPWEFPGMRMLMAMACKAMVVSEHTEDIAPYINGEHLMMAPRNDLAGLIVSCLKDGAVRRKITDRAYRFVTEQNTLELRLASAFGVPPVL